MIKEKEFKKLSVLIFVAVLIVLSFIILKPVILSVITGLLLGYIFYPVYRKIFGVVKEENISALIICLVVLFLIFVPIWFLIPTILKQIFEVYSYLQGINLNDLLARVIPFGSSEFFSREMFTVYNTFIDKFINIAMNSFSNILMDLPAILIQAVVVLFVFFFTMRDGEGLKAYIMEMSPFDGKVHKDLIKRFDDITHSVVYGHILVGIIQGLLTGLGLFIFGVPRPLLFTILAIFASILPVIGAWFVWIPAGIYLLISGHLGAGIGLLLYGAILVSWIDNIIRPYIVARKAKISSAVVLVGMIGGFFMFGIVGFVIGPLILSYLLMILDLYKQRKLFR